MSATYSNPASVSAREIPQFLDTLEFSCLICSSDMDSEFISYLHIRGEHQLE